MANCRACAKKIISRRRQLIAFGVKRSYITSAPSHLVTWQYNTASLNRLKLQGLTEFPRNLPDTKGASINDVRTQGWGGVVVEKQTKVLISCVSGIVTRGEGVEDVIKERFCFVNDVR